MVKTWSRHGPNLVGSREGHERDLAETEKIPGFDCIIRLREWKEWENVNDLKKSGFQQETWSRVGQDLVKTWSKLGREPRGT